MVTARPSVKASGVPILMTPCAVAAVAPKTKAAALANATAKADLLVIFECVFVSLIDVGPFVRGLILKLT
ncbi:hypothetical protein OAJ57_01760 [Alphaproteobacteria bacterium]|nr:hypothetical protein [Alphaproteobacteria bacterium]